MLTIKIQRNTLVIVLIAILLISVSSFSFAAPPNALDKDYVAGDAHMHTKYSGEPMTDTVE